MPSLTNLKNDLAALLTPLRDITTTAEKEDRDLTGEERARIEKGFTAAAAIKDQITRQQKDLDLRTQLSQLGEGIGVLEPSPSVNGGTPVARQKGKSLGEQFTESAQLSALMKRFSGGRIPEKAAVQSDPWHVKSLITATDDASAGAFVLPQHLGFLNNFDLFQRPLSIRQLVTGNTTSTDTIDYVQAKSVTNNAAPVPEATETTGTSGTKPESGFTFEPGKTTVKTIAHWMPVTNRALSDASQIRGMIDSFLLYGLEEELEDQLVFGDGTGENLLGITNIPGIQQQAVSGNLFDTTRKARTKVKLIGRSTPTAYVMNPMDWENIDLLQDNTGKYYNGGPFTQGPHTLWGLPVVESEVIPAGTAYVADWSRAVLWDREQSSITVSNSHADFFIRNMIAILAEMRAAFAILRPSAFVKIDLTGAAAITTPATKK